MPVFDAVAMREPVFYRIPSDPEDSPGRVVKQFRKLQLDIWDRIRDLYAADKTNLEAGRLMLDLIRYAIDGVTDAELEKFGDDDYKNVILLAQGKARQLEAALGNARSDGVSLTKTETPSPTTPDSTTTATETASLAA
jgi:hypothetical protein